jgi:outer membrane lipoprotein
LLLSGCASTDCPIPANIVTLTPEDATEGRLAEGALVRWGGILAATRNLADRTELEVIGYPLTSCGRPRTGNRPVGRFVIVHPGYLETAPYRPGEMISATGRFLGLRPDSSGGTGRGYPHIESFHPQRWGASPPAAEGYWRPRISIGIGGGSGGGIGGGVGVMF